jgi:hypothetical protein
LLILERWHAIEYIYRHIFEYPPGSEQNRVVRGIIFRLIVLHESRKLVGDILNEIDVVSAGGEPYDSA